MAVFFCELCNKQYTKVWGARREKECVREREREKEEIGEIDGERETISIIYILA